MKQLLLFCLFVLLVIAQSSGQAKTRKLSNSINHPSVNLYSPYTSADGSTLVFVSDNAEDGALTPFFTFREGGDWTEPRTFPKSVYSRLNFLHGNALSADGKTLYFSTLKSPSVGSFDIFKSDWNGTAWTEPQNLGAPINSKMGDACPSISADGSTMYFMRCEAMDQQAASGCKIFRVKKKSNGQWDEPVELPASINTGNSQAPRIAADNQTLIFSSDMIKPNKGGMDLYVTKFDGTNWSKPVALDFVNTDKNDQYVTVNAVGRYLLKDAQGSRKNELVEFLFPEELRPKSMMKVEGRVVDATDKPAAGYLTVIDLATGKKSFTGRPEKDGTFFFYLAEGTRYEFSVDPEFDNISFFSKYYDLTSDRIPQGDRVTAVLKPVAAGTELTTPGITFNERSTSLSKSAKGELSRLARVINANPGLNFEIHIAFAGFMEDTVQSDPDLTELVYDTIVYEYKGVDSLANMFQEDSIAIRTHYHNNRTESQAKAIIDELVQMGVSESRLSYRVYVSPATLPEDKKTVVSISARSK